MIVRLRPACELVSGYIVTARWDELILYGELTPTKILEFKHGGKEANNMFSLGDYKALMVHNARQLERKN